jgi:O-antigen ligase/tetratricopeptide (TPR) repeat protein
MNNLPPLALKSARALLLTFVVAAPLLFSTVLVENFEDAKSAALSLTVLALAALGVAGLSVNESPRELLRRPLILGVLLFALSAILSTVSSISPLTSWRGATESYGGLTTILGYVVLFFAARQFGGGRRALAGVVVAAGAAAGYALLQAAHLDPVTWDGAPVFGAQLRPFSTFGHANLLGAYLAMSLPILGYFAVRWAQRRRWILVGLLAVVSTVVLPALVLTLSRAAWLAAGCAVALLLASLWWAQARRAATAVFVGLLVLTGVGGLAYERHWLPDSVRSALSERVGHLDDAAGRRDIWRAGWQIYCDHPLAGSGLDTFRLAFGTKRTAAFWDKEGDGTPTRAHNEAIHVLATQGTLGGIALIVLLVGLGWATVQAWRRTGDRALVVAVAASVAAFLVTGLFGFTVISTGSLFVVCAGLLSRWGEPTGSGCERAVAPKSPGFRHWVAAGVTVVAFGAALFGVLQPLWANVACHRGDVALADDSARALKEYRRATELDANCALYWVRLADAAQREARRTGSGELTQEARAALERAAELVPGDAYHHLNVGRLLGELAVADRSLKEPALAAIRRGMALDPNNSCLLQEAARTALTLGDYESARQYAEHGIALYPAWGCFHAHLGAAAFGQGRLEEAAVDLERAVAGEWHNDAEGLSRALATLAATELRLHDYVKAQEFAGRASVWLPQWPTPHLIRSQALQALGQRDEAAQEFRAAQTLLGRPPASVISSNQHSAPSDTSASQCAE